MASHQKELQEVSRRYRAAVKALQKLDDSRVLLREAALTAHEAGASKTAIARTVGVSRQRMDDILRRARHERAAGVDSASS